MATKHSDMCLQKAGDDEPVFTLRAHDKLSAWAVRHWALMAKVAGTPQDKVDEALRCANAMEAWQAENGCKVPD